MDSNQLPLDLQPNGLTQGSRRHYHRKSAKTPFLLHFSDGWARLVVTKVTSAKINGV